MPKGNTFDAGAVVAAAGRVAVLMGGHSAEREISLRSGDAVLNALRASGIDAIGIDWNGSLLAQLMAVKPTRVFIALHGRGGEDGCVQGALEIAGLPYTGSGVLGSSLAMDKVRSKRVWLQQGIPTPDFVLADDSLSPTAIIERLGLPLMVKPAHEGSSVGVSKVETLAELAPAIAHAKTYDTNVLIEQFIRGGEYTLSIVDGMALPIIKLETPRAFYDYEAKYHADSTRYSCPAGLSDEDECSFSHLGLQAFNALDASGWGRVDFMVDSAGRPWFIELNTVPGMTDHSLVPMAARQSGWGFETLVLRILATSFRESTWLKR
jgi:D-alanine-D-alanine ligase